MDPLFEDVKKFIRDAFTGNLELPTFSIGDTGDTTKSILRAVLPPPQPFDLFKPASYPSNFIPDEVYEYAGINPQTGETIAPPPIASAPVDSGLTAAAAATPCNPAPALAHALAFSRVPRFRRLECPPR